MNSSDAVAALSPEQKNILNQFREAVQDILHPDHDDYYLLRWLRARDYDITKSEKMIRESYKFKKKINMDEDVIDKYVEPEVHKKYMKSAMLGFDKEGCLVRCIMMGIFDFKGLVYCIPTMEFKRLFMYYLECDLKAIAEHNSMTGLHEVRAVYIIDCREFSMKEYCDKHAIQELIQACRMYQDNFPETLKKAFITNVPNYFYWLWNILKPFLDPVTLKKIKICKTGDESWKEELLAMADPEIIPAFLGGLRCDPDGDPTCQNIIRWNDNKIPTSYYLTDKCVLNAEDPDVNSVVVREKSYFELKIPIEKPSSILRWEFQTKQYNIRFGVFYKKITASRQANVSPDELVPVENVECHVIPETGEHLCEKAGQYILHFDNKYSWLTSKHLTYKVTVIEPEDTNDGTN